MASHWSRGSRAACPQRPVLRANTLPRQVPESVNVQMRMFPAYEIVADDFRRQFEPNPDNPRLNVDGGKLRSQHSSAYYFYGTCGHAIQIAIIIGGVFAARHMICEES